MGTKAPDGGEDDARASGQRGPEREDEHAKSPDVDAESADHLAVVSAGLYLGSVGRLLEKEPDHPHQNQADERGEKAVLRIRQFADDQGSVDALGNGKPLFAFAPDDANCLFEHEARTEREKETIFGFLAVRSPNQTLEPHSKGADDDRREHEGHAITQRQRKPAVSGSHRAETDWIHDLHRDVSAQCEQRTVRQVDHLHDAHDQHETERKKAEQDAEGDAVDDVRKQMHGPGAPLRLVNRSRLERLQLALGFGLRVDDLVRGGVA